MSAVPTGTTLEPRHLLAVEALASGATNEEAAKAAGVTSDAVSAWKRWPLFRAAVDAATEEIVSSARDLAKSAARQAMRNLVNAVNLGDVDASLALLDRIGLAKGAKIEHSGPGGGAVQVDLRAAVREALRALPDSDVVPK